MSIIIMKCEKVSLSEKSWTGSFFCTKLHDRIIEIDWLDAIDFIPKKGYNVLNHTIVYLIALSLVQR